MPIIHFDGPAMSKEQKADLVSRMTEAAHGVLPEIPVEAFTVIIKENGPDNIGVGGRLLSERRRV